MAGREPAVGLLGEDDRVMVSLRRLLIAVAVLPLLVSGCTGDPEPRTEPSPSASSPTTSPSTAKPVPRPQERACYRLTYAAAVAPTSDARGVACASRHTSQTYAVGTLDTLVGGHLLAVDSDHVQAQVAATCPRRLSGFLGGDAADLHLSMLRAVWFTPTVAESDAGADWYRCDVIAVASDQHLSPLSGRLGGVLNSAAGRDRYGMCGTDEPGTPDFVRVICTADHTWRAIATVDFPDARYPGTGAARDRGQGPCENAGRGVASDALSFQWGYEWPTADQWHAGQRYGLCWAPD
ncbi:septum formation family protein [Nocardioides sp.]|uniref:septum formation family protein n=1 Tax=Nocardioides sp. TaxID=35761 RepID=UPI0031FF14E9